MKKIMFLTLFALLLAGVPGKAVAQNVTYTPVNFDPAVKYQTMTGWGASLAFYEGWLTAHPKKAEIYDVIFKELSLDILRVRNAYDYDNTMIGRVKEFNQAAQKSLGHPIDILVSSWGPPAYLKSNNDKNNGGTLKYTVSDGKVNFNYAGFARWWNLSLDDYNKNGVYPKYVSIQNEPDWKADYESCLLQPCGNLHRHRHHCRVQQSPRCCLRYHSKKNPYPPVSWALNVWASAISEIPRTAWKDMLTPLIRVSCTASPTIFTTEPTRPAPGTRPISEKWVPTAPRFPTSRPNTAAANGFL